MIFFGEPHKIFRNDPPVCQYEPALSEEFLSLPETKSPQNQETTTKRACQSNTTHTPQSNREHRQNLEPSILYPRSHPVFDGMCALETWRQSCYGYYPPKVPTAEAIPPRRIRALGFLLLQGYSYLTSTSMYIFIEKRVTPPVYATSLDAFSKYQDTCTLSLTAKSSGVISRQSLEEAIASSLE